MGESGAYGSGESGGMGGTYGSQTAPGHQRREQYGEQDPEREREMRGGYGGTGGQAGSGEYRTQGSGREHGERGW